MVNTFSMSEISEVSQTKFSDCDLGKAAELSKGDSVEIGKNDPSIYDESLAKPCPSERIGDGKETQGDLRDEGAYYKDSDANRPIVESGDLSESIGDQQPTDMPKDMPRPGPDYLTKGDETQNKTAESEKTDDTKETRELTDEEKQHLKDTLGWSDKQIAKCTIDEDGVIHYKTDRSDLEGKTSENGVPYERRTIEINGVKIEGVFPKFESAFDTQLDPDNLKTKAYAKECNAKLKEAVENDPELRSKFTEEQLKDIEEGRTPTGYVWHHNEEPGKMQLVKKEDHDRTSGGAAHTGGNSLWGADSCENSQKGESF